MRLQLRQKKEKLNRLAGGRGLQERKQLIQKAQRDTPQREFGKQKVGQCCWSSDRRMGVGGIWGL